MGPFPIAFGLPRPHDTFILRFFPFFTPIIFILNQLPDSYRRNVSPANYTLRYNVMPYVGVLTYGEAARTSEAVPFPEGRSEVA
ncbi:hypothetical protein PHLCEN_2v11516 [Hermanssonia centrifuga]|uniref:Uncharacterized protein n=1 Tax=Hermanssonia centrifuga TaxID=98765 RepID=A0A2R6NKW3_9APHY|nr:hypothetical protein PHLCEN_2v11516 [Hermanssonia centrifuga]